jgi:hypothetical protein
VDDRVIGIQSPAEAKLFFFLASVFKLVIGPSQPPGQWVQELMFRIVSWDMLPCKMIVDRRFGVLFPGVMSG